MSKVSHNNKESSREIGNLGWWEKSSKIRERSKEVSTRAIL